MKRTPIKKKGQKKLLREQIGKYHFEILIIERGHRCEISGRPAQGLGRFHILPVGRYPELEFHSHNVLLANWMPYHYAWHHCNSDDMNWLRTKDGIVRARGKDYEQVLKGLALIQPKHNETYLRFLLQAFKEKLKGLR